MTRQHLLAIVSMLLVGLLGMPLEAQDKDRNQSGGGNRVRDDFPGRGGGRGGFDGPNMEGGPIGRGPGMRGPEMASYEMLRSYIEVVDRFSKLVQDPQAAGIAAVVSASNLLRQRGPDEAITYFTGVLADVKDPAIRRAIRIQLVDLYKQSNQTDKALEQLDLLMKNTLTNGAPTTAPAP